MIVIGRWDIMKFIKVVVDEFVYDGQKFYHPVFFADGGSVCDTITICGKNHKHKKELDKYISEMKEMIKKW